MISYQGSKKREINKILEILPNAKNFVDVFGGAGNVCFNPSVRERYEQIHYNDLNRWVYLLALQYQKKEKIPLLELEPTPENFKKLNSAYLKRELTDLNQYIWLKRQVYRGLLGAYIQELDNHKPRTNKEFVFNKSVIVEKEDIITNLDYRKIFDMYRDDCDAVLYCDPPYKSDFKIFDNTEYEENNKVDSDYNTNILELMTESEAKIILHVPFNGYLYHRIHFPEEHDAENKKPLYISKLYPMTYNIKLGRKPTNYHCLITNWDFSK